MGLAKKYFLFVSDVLESIITGPRIIWLWVFMLVGVFHLPFEHALHAIMHLDDPNATMGIPNWPELNNLLFFLHIVAAIPATFLGPLMFIPSYRKAYPKHHRWIGTIYVFGCLLSAVTVFPLALANKAGFVAHLGFGMMSIIWFAVTYFAYTSARQKNYVSHRRWMLRSYAMTFAFVHVNFTYLLIGVYEGIMTVEGVKVMQSMVSWMFNLFLVELYLAATAVNGRWLGFKKWIYNLSHVSSVDKYFLSFKRIKKV